MQYLILLYGDEAAGGSPEEMSSELTSEWTTYEAEMSGIGRLVTRDALARTAAAKRLRLEGHAR
jgi:hypothetical protein